mmetsp:Transcript_30732/g.64971  ORF Transcript_30732/g.64971 Transcript_30732/m.64971 type:complete len:170 (+) Transcript_30732:33-542(+)
MFLLYAVQYLRNLIMVSYLTKSHESRSPCLRNMMWHHTVSHTGNNSVCIEYVVFTFPPGLPPAPLSSILRSTNTVAINVDPFGIFVQHFSTVRNTPMDGSDDVASEDHVYTSILPRESSPPPPLARFDPPPRPAVARGNTAALAKRFDTYKIHPVAKYNIAAAVQNTKS